MLEFVVVLRRYDVTFTPIVQMYLLRACLVYTFALYSALLYVRYSIYRDKASRSPFLFHNFPSLLRGLDRFLSSPAKILLVSI